MTVKKIFLVLLTWALTSATGLAQNTFQSGGHNFEQYEREHAVISLLQDSKGLLWLGTTNGVSVYDGYTFKDYKQNLLDSAGFQGVAINALYEDGQGNIWIGSHESGLSVYATQTQSFEHYGLPKDPWQLPSLEIKSIVGDKKGEVWMASGHTITHVTNTGDLADANVNTIMAKDLGISGIHKLFRATSGRLFVLGKQLHELVVSGNGNIESKLIFDGEGLPDMIEVEPDVFLVATGNQVYLFKDGEFSPILSNDADKFVSLFQDKKGVIWAGCNQSIIRVTFNQTFLVKDEKTFKSGRIQDIIQDTSGNLFFATRRQGLLKLGWNYHQYTYVSLPDQFKNEFVFKFFEDQQGNLWAGSFNGLFKYNPVSGELSEYINEPGNLRSLSDNSNYSINDDRDGNVLIATGIGLNKYHPGSDSFDRIDASGEFGPGFSHHLLKDARGDVWFIADERLKKISGTDDEILTFDTMDGEDLRLGNAFIDDENYLWIADLGRVGLSKLDISSGQPEMVAHYLPNIIDYLHWMEEDLVGNLWISWSHGVIVINKQTGQIIRNFNAMNGLLQDNVYEIIRDNNGLMWLKQDQFGSISINPKTFEPVSFTPNWLNRPQVKKYACVSGKGRDGKLITDGWGGFHVFHPDSILINPNAPELILNELIVNNISAPKSNTGGVAPNLELLHDENNVEFRYTGLQFDNSERNTYAYFLEGYHQDWQLVGKSRQAFFFGLGAGKYTFRLKAANSDGVWSDSATLATFEINPPWQRSILALVFYVVLMLSFVYYIYKQQLTRRLVMSEANRLKDVDEFKNKFFTNITHEFRTPLTVILGMAEKLQGKSGHLIRRNARQLLDLINQILELSKLETKSASITLEKGNIITYIKYLIESFMSLANDRGIKLELESNPSVIEMDFDQEKIQLIVNNLLSNALKFTDKGGHVLLTVQDSSKYLEFCVSDTGVGVDEDKLENIFDRYYQLDNTEANYEGTGIGLALTRELVLLMGGDIRVQSEKNVGSTFIVRLPITRNAREMVLPEHEVVKLNVDLEADVAPSNGERLQVLVVEDNADVASFVHSVLSDRYDVIQAENGEEGIDKARQVIPDMIISDVMMPRKDGLEVTEVLKSDQKTSHIPIVLLTARADIESRLTGLRKGADVYLAKPFNEAELLLHLNNLMELRGRMHEKYVEGVVPVVVGKADNLEDEFIAGIYELILTNLSKSYGIDEICRDMAVSRTQLHRKLKALTGKSASIFIRDIRLVEARKLLNTTAMNISEIAYQVGFNDPNYFSKLYSDKFGTAPTRERETTQ